VAFDLRDDFVGGVTEGGWEEFSGLWVFGCVARGVSF